ncbi:IS3 family transposase [Clostridium perfringens]
MEQLSEEARFLAIHKIKTFEELRRVVFEFIESWYNRKRIHSSINYRTPEEIEKQAV